MRPTLFRTVLPFDEALRRTLDAAEPIGRVEDVPLSDLDRRVTAVDVVAKADVPPFDRAAMDGYAVRAEDTTQASVDAPRMLTCIGVLFTGQWPDRPVEPGQCLEIATGAPMPPGATAVVMVEHTSRDDDSVLIHQPVAPGQHIGRRGADMKAGASILATGDVLTPGRVGAVAGAGLDRLQMYARPTVAIISTGNEVVGPGQPLAPGQIHNINQFTLTAIVRRHGGVPTVLPIASDSVDELSRAIDAFAGHDLAVFSGGSSVGRRDLMLDALAARGEILFHGIAVKPGKPTLLARVGRTLVLGMPGNPASCLSNAYMLLIPLVRKIARLEPWTPETRRVPLARRVTSTVDRHQFYTVKLVKGTAEPAFKGSGEITSMANADGYFEIPAGTDTVEAGTEVIVKLFDSHRESAI